MNSKRKIKRTYFRYFLMLFEILSVGLKVTICMRVRKRERCTYTDFFGYILYRTIYTAEQCSSEVRHSLQHKDFFCVGESSLQSCWWEKSPTKLKLYTVRETEFLQPTDTLLL